MTSEFGNLAGRTALLTGGGRGIGQAIALKLGRAGAKVLVNDFDAEPAKATVEIIRESGGEADVFIGDVREDNFGDRFIQHAVATCRSVDIIINNAGYTRDAVIQKMSDAEWREILDVHLTAPFRILRAAQPVFKQQAAADAGAGRRLVRKVVNVSSISGLFGIAGQSNYSSAKAGLIGLTQVLAKEWGRYGVTVNCVAFGLIGTRLGTIKSSTTKVRIGREDVSVGMNSDLHKDLQSRIPLGRVGTVEEAAGAVYLFCTPESDYISGQTVLCSGGLTSI